MDTAGTDDMKIALERVRADIDLIDADIQTVEKELSRLQSKRVQALNAAEYIEGMMARRGVPHRQSNSSKVLDATNTEEDVERRSDQSKRPRKLSKPSGRKQVVDFAQEILAGREAPLEPQELYRLMTERGITMATKNPSHTVRRTLNELPELFEHVPGKGYRLANADVATATS